MKLLLSFAVGAILGDIFFHLIPESFQSHIDELGDSAEVAHKKVGVSIVAGIFMFIIVEMILEKWSDPTTDDSREAALSLNGKIKPNTISSKDHVINSNTNDIPIFSNQDLIKPTMTEPLVFSTVETMENNNCLLTDLNSFSSVNNPKVDTNFAMNMSTANNGIKQVSQELKLRKRGTPDPKSLTITNKCSILKETKSNGSLRSSSSNERCVKRLKESKTILNECQIIDVAGYLSLIANGFDNFTHGLAIGASFLVGSKVGLLTTFVIFIHEIPHEICDYAILVNAGFSRWDAVKAQSSVSLFGILGTATALYVKSVQTLNSRTVWILPFSAGGFLYIALVNLLPEILDNKNDFLSSIGQIACVILGVAFMALVAIM